MSPDEVEWAKERQDINNESEYTFDSPVAHRYLRFGTPGIYEGNKSCIVRWQESGPLQDPPSRLPIAYGLALTANTFTLPPSLRP